MDPRPLIVAFALAACAGPRPRAEVVAVEPSPLPGHARVTLDVRNESGGHGDVELMIVLTSVGGRRIHEQRTIELDTHEHVELAIDIPAPADSYVATVRAKYPD